MSEKNLYVETNYFGRKIFLKVIKTTKTHYHTRTYPTLNLRGATTNDNAKDIIRWEKRNNVVMFTEAEAAIKQNVFE